LTHEVQSVEKIIDFLSRTIRQLLTIFLLALSLIIFCNVLFRYVFSLPLHWTEEISTLLFVWVVFLGAADLQRQGKHIAIDTLYIRCSPAVKKRMEIFGQILTLCVLVLLVISSVKATWLQSRSVTMLLGMPVSVFGAVVLISSVLMFFYTLLSTIKKIGNLSKE